MAARELDNFRSNLRSRCAERGACRRLADAAGISRPYLSEIMRGAKTPSLAIAIDIARALETSLDELIALDTDVRRPRNANA